MGHLKVGSGVDIDTGINTYELDLRGRLGFTSRDEANTFRERLREHGLAVRITDITDRRICSEFSVAWWPK